MNFKIVFKTIHWCISWGIKNFDVTACISANVSRCLIPPAVVTTVLYPCCISTVVLHTPSDFRQDASNITCTAQEYFARRRNKQIAVEHYKMFIISIQLHVSAFIRIFLCFKVIYLFILHSTMHSGMYDFKKIHFS